MALPGGRRDTSDVSDLATVLRETQEEVGIDLVHEAELLGPLDSLQATARGRRIALTITPFVFYVKTLTPVVPSIEVSSAHWVPITPLIDGSASTQLTITFPEGVVTLPAWNVAGNHVWGLTYRMVQSLFALLPPATPLPHPCT
jgi:8-oxo-dGTP pyrophosphatase MutT (NUDIX family)